jgi:fermentation-respiration switch protein FrsA (DUF1100 family)
MKLVFWITVSAVLFLAAMRYIERQSIYFPMREITDTPARVGLEYRDIYFKSADGTRLNGWFIPARNAKYTLVLAHGNAGNISHRIEKILIFHGLGLNVFVFDYRGYGRSEGQPSEKGLYQDLRAAHSYVVAEEKVPARDIILYGESIGGAVAIDLARRSEEGALITEDTFTSVKDMAGMAFPLVPNFIFSSKYDSLSKIKDVACPKLIIHSIDDEIVPFRQGEKLYAAAKEPKRFLKLRGSHNTAFMESDKEYVEGLKEFINKIQ